MGRKAKKRASAAAGQQPTESIRAADGPGERATDEGAPEGSRVESPTAEAEPSSRQLAAAAPTTLSSPPPPPQGASGGRRWVYAATAVLALATGAAAKAAGVDCSPLKRWSPAANYKKGDLIWSWDGDARSLGASYLCAHDVCRGGGTIQLPQVPDEPSFASPVWALVGGCSTAGIRDPSE